MLLAAGLEPREAAKEVLGLMKDAQPNTQHSPGAIYVLTHVLSEIKRDLAPTPGAPQLKALKQLRALREEHEFMSGVAAEVMTQFKTRADELEQAACDLNQAIADSQQPTNTFDVSDPTSRMNAVYRFFQMEEPDNDSKDTSGRQVNDLLSAAMTRYGYKGKTDPMIFLSKCCVATVYKIYMDAGEMGMKLPNLDVRVKPTFKDGTVRPCKPEDKAYMINMLLAPES